MQNSFYTPAQSQATADTRYPTAVVNISWEQSLGSGIFAIVGSSLVGGIDIVAGSTNFPVPWDKYVYMDETESVMAFDYDREIEEPAGGIAGATLDLILDNTDKRFTPNYDSTIGTAVVKTNRPVSISAGFVSGGSGRTVPIFKGSTFTDIEPDFMDRRVYVRAADIITLLDQKTLAAAVYVNQRSDEIIEAILSDAGVGSTQRILDTGLNTIPFAWFPADMHALARIRKICEAEEATFYQDEQGRCCFETRLHYQAYPHRNTQITLYGRHLLEYNRVQNTAVINRCVVKALPRQVDAANSVIWSQPEEIEVAGSSSKTIWARFTDADTSVEMPAYSVEQPIATTDYTAWTGADGTGSNITADQTVTVTNFVETAKIVLTNANVSAAFYNFLQLQGKGARVQKSIEAVSEDAVSIGKYGVREYPIYNDFIQDLDWAESIADAMVGKYKDPTARLRVKIPALPHLQLKDKVAIVDPDLNTSKDYRVMRIMGKFIPGSYTQDVILREVDSSETAT